MTSRGNPFKGKYLLFDKNFTKKNFLIVIVFFFFVILFVTCRTGSNQSIPKEEKIKKGKDLFQSAVCFQCHSLKGDKLYGPPLDSLYNTSVIVIEKGKKKKVLVDKKYLIESIKHPEKMKVVGFEKSTMPETSLNDEQIKNIVEYLIFINEKQHSKD